MTNPVVFKFGIAVPTPAISKVLNNVSNLDYDRINVKHKICSNNCKIVTDIFKLFNERYVLLILGIFLF